MALKWPAKDPNERLDYQLDWSARLDGDTIATSTWTVPPGITAVIDTSTTTTTTRWLEGGTEGETYTLINRVTTAAGRIMEQSVSIRIKER